MPFFKLFVLNKNFTYNQYFVNVVSANAILQLRIYYF